MSKEDFKNRKDIAQAMLFLTCHAILFLNIIFIVFLKSSSINIKFMYIVFTSRFSNLRNSAILLVKDSTKIWYFHEKERPCIIQGRSFSVLIIEQCATKIWHFYVYFFIDCYD
jgi:hypothetical protein